MRRLSLFVLCSVAASGCSAVADFGFTFGDGGSDASSDGAPGDMPHPDGGMDGGGTDGGDAGDAGDVDFGPVDLGPDLNFDAGIPCMTTCDDGDPCNGVEACDTTMGSCVAGTPVTCTPSDACHAAGSCDPTTGACTAGAALVVDDGNPCNGVETCSDMGGTMVVTSSGPRCDDHIGCTQDTCDMMTGACTNTPVDSMCSGMTEICRVMPPVCSMTACTLDSDCTGGDHCFGGHCCSAASGGCIVVACTTNAMCDDGLHCNGAETCDMTSHTCSSGTAPDCRDALACSADSCIEGGAGGYTCRHLPGDGDGDTFPSATCIPGMGSDCNDSDPSINPLATEVCDGVDQDCNGIADDPFLTGPFALMHVCSMGVGACMMGGQYVCAPSHASTVCNAMTGSPGANELCGNMVDDNCNGSVDEGFSNLGTSCSAGVGACMHTGTWVCSADQLSLVCNTGPGMPGTELCGNGMDDDCDGMVDEGFPTIGMSCSVGTGACVRMGTYVCSLPDRLSAVCNVSPGSPSPEVCNGVDDDCNGLVDDGVTVNYWHDNDGDGYGSGPMMTGCLPTSTGWATRGGDCNDFNNAINPGVMEVCYDMLDNNCDGTIDELCPPMNDHCAGGTARSLGTLRPGNSGTMTQSFDYATKDLSDCGAGVDVFFTFTVPPGPAEVVYFDTFGSTFDTELSIRDSCASPITACTDDACSVLQSQMVQVMPAGGAARSYTLAAHAYSSGLATGQTLYLTWQVLPGASGTIQQLPAPGTYTETTPPAAPGIVASNGCAATTNMQTGAHPEDLYWMVSCPMATHILSVNTCGTASTDNTVLYVRPGTSMLDFACNDDDSTCAPRSSINATIAGAGIWGLWVDYGDPPPPPMPPPATYSLRVTSY